MTCGPSPIFINKVLLAHGHTPRFMYCPQRLSHSRAGAEKQHTPTRAVPRPPGCPLMIALKIAGQKVLPVPLPHQVQCQASFFPILAASSCLLPDGGRPQLCNGEGPQGLAHPAMEMKSRWDAKLLKANPPSSPCPMHRVSWPLWWSPRDRNCGHHQ